MLNILLPIRKTKTVLFGLIVLVASFIIFSGKTHAATLTVSSGCTFDEEVAVLNDAVDGNGCVNSGAAYGTTNTINLPSGTSTVATDTESYIAGGLIIQGAGKTSSILDFNSNQGFTAYNQSANFTVKDFTAENATKAAIEITGLNSVVNLSDMEVTNSENGISLSAVEINVNEVNIHDNNFDDSAISCGLNVDLKSSAPSDILKANIQNVKVKNNSCNSSGFILHSTTDESASQQASVKYVEVSNNTGKDIGAITGSSAVQLLFDSSSAVTLNVDSVTVANNSVTSTIDHTGDQPFSTSRITGFQLSYLSLNPGLHFTNVTVAYNSIVNTLDDAISIAGFFGVTFNSAQFPSLTNITVVGNSVTQTTPSSSLSRFPAFLLIGITASEENVPQSAEGGGTAENTLVAHNLYNGEVVNCENEADFSVVGLTGTVDVTPQNLGHNLSDDQKCTGYTYVPNLYDTIDHEVKDNGGPVPTIALHSDSPAVNGGGQVLGISTDARGIARTGYYSVGANQGVLLAASTNESNSLTGTLAETGVVAISSAVLSIIALISLILIWRDYRRHKKPLMQVNPQVKYSMPHHIKVVVIPLVKYRLSLRLSRQDDRISKF